MELMPFEVNRQRLTSSSDSPSSDMALDDLWQSQQAERALSSRQATRMSPKMTKRSQSSEYLLLLGGRAGSSSAPASESSMPSRGTPTVNSSWSLTVSPRAGSTSAVDDYIDPPGSAMLQRRFRASEEISRKIRSLTVPPSPSKYRSTSAMLAGSEADGGSSEFQSALYSQELLSVQMAKDIAVFCTAVKVKFQSALHVGAALILSVAMVSYLLTASSPPELR